MRATTAGEMRIDSIALTMTPALWSGMKRGGIDMPEKRNVKEKALQLMLDTIRRTAVKNAGAASIKGAYEAEVPKKLQGFTEQNKNLGGGVITTNNKIYETAVMVSIVLLAAVCWLVRYI